MARKSIIETELSANDAGFTITVEGVGTIAICLTDLTPAIVNRAAIHGLIQKISDAAAIKKDELPADPAEAARVKFAAMDAVASRIRDGEWNKNTGEGGGAVSGIIYRAFAEWVADNAKAAKSPVPDDAAIRALYDGMDRAGQLALRTIPAIAKIIERIKSERGAAKTPAVDGAALLAALLGGK